MGSPNRSTMHEPRRAVAVVGTLMPHLAAERHHIYRNATALALLAALIAAAFGSLSIALVLAAVALPAVVLTYIHDHNLWRDEPITVIAVTFALSLGLGVGVGFLQTYFTPGVALAGHYRLPSLSRILELGVLVPVVAFVAVLVAPLLVTTRAAFRHPMDVVVTCALSGAALSLGLSVVVQHGAFTHLQATAGDPAHVAFIALTLGFVQPVILATAAAVAVLGLRSAGVNPAVGVIEGAVLLMLYGLATTLLAPYGSRGIVLTTFAAFVLAGSGLVATRTALHTAVDTAPDVGRVEHRLHGAVVAAIVAVVVIVAAGVTAAVVFSGTSTPPKPPTTRPGGGIVPTPHAAGAIHPGTGPGLTPGRDHSLGDVMLASTATTLAFGDASTINFGNGVTLTVAPGWTIDSQNQGSVLLFNGNQSAGMYAAAGNANTSNIDREATLLINQQIKGVGLSDVQTDPQAQSQSVQGNNFQQLLPVNYTANLQTNQGTVQLYGIWVTLFNPSTHTSGFIDFFAGSSNAFQAASPDAEHMVGSML
jgi:hypothetical protein